MSDTVVDLDLVREELNAEQEMNSLLLESMADLELALEDRGWRKLGVDSEREFSREGLKRAAEAGRILAVANPLINRGLSLRTAYVWGQGVDIQARANGEDGEGQNVNDVVQTFLEDNRATLTSGQAHETHERALGTDGNRLFALFTSPLTGRVQVRSMPWDEFQDVIANPDDRDDPWYYLREWSSTVVEAGYAGIRTRNQTQRAYYPAVGYRPRIRPRAINGIPVMWDAPILHVKVNALDGWKWGIGDVYPALGWARSYDGFLTDWAKLVKSLSRFAWRATGDTKGRAQQAAAKIRAAVQRPTDPNTSQAGGIAAGGPGTNLEAIPKSGATIDSESGRPLAAMVAAALGVPVTMLLADPGQTGARAVAETLDKPTQLEMGMRRELWGDVYRTILDYVIDQAVKAPQGRLKGTIGRDEYGREQIVLADDTDRTVDITWPDIDETDPKTLVDAIVAADGTAKMPPLQTAKLLLLALGVDDVDELLKDMVDGEGNFIDPTRSVGDATAQAALDAFRRGEDPAAAIRGGDE